MTRPHAPTSARARDAGLAGVLLLSMGLGCSSAGRVEPARSPGGPRLDAPTTDAPAAPSDPLTVERIQAVMRVLLPGLRSCYAAWMVEHGVRAGEATLRFVIDLRGRVRELEVETTLGSEAFSRCLQEVLASARFPPPFEEAFVTYPLQFRPDRGGR